MQDLIPKYKRLFGIECSLVEFSLQELKRRWKILCQKYHPDKGGSAKHFIFVQSGYIELKKHCKGKKQKNSTSSFTSVVGIGEIKIPLSNGGFAYIWDVGEANFKKRYEWEKTHGVNLNKYY